MRSRTKPALKKFSRTGKQAKREEWNQTRVPSKVKKKKTGPFSEHVMATGVREVGNGQLIRDGDERAINEAVKGFTSAKASSDSSPKAGIREAGVGVKGEHFIRI